MHTTSILIDDRLSVIGSFNWDMRSAYLYTELMLLVDCPALNAALREQTEEMMRQSRLVLPGGTETAGAAYIAPERSPLKAACSPSYASSSARSGSCCKPPRRAGCGADSVPKFYLRSRIIQANRKKTCDNMKHKKRRRLLHAGFCGV